MQILQFFSSSIKVVCLFVWIVFASLNSKSALSGYNRDGTGTYDDPYVITYYSSAGWGFYSSRGQSSVNNVDSETFSYVSVEKQRDEYNDIEDLGTPTMPDRVNRNYTGSNTVLSVNDVRENLTGRLGATYSWTLKEYQNEAPSNPLDPDIRRTLLSQHNFIGNVDFPNTANERCTLNAVASRQALVPAAPVAGFVSVAQVLVTFKNELIFDCTVGVSHTAHIVISRDNTVVFEGEATNVVPDIPAPPLLAAMPENSTMLSNDLVQSWNSMYADDKVNSFKNCNFPFQFWFCFWYTSDELRYWFDYPFRT